MSHDWGGLCRPRSCWNTGQCNKQFLINNEIPVYTAKRSLALLPGHCSYTEKMAVRLWNVSTAGEKKPRRVRHLSLLSPHADPDRSIEGRRPIDGESSHGLTLIANNVIWLVGHTMWTNSAVDKSNSVYDFRQKQKNIWLIFWNSTFRIKNRNWFLTARAFIGGYQKSTKNSFIQDQLNENFFCRKSMTNWQMKRANQFFFAWP